MAPHDNGPRAHGTLWRAGGVGLVLKGGSVALTVAVTVLLARTLGPGGYGTYAFVLALVTLIGIPAQAGLPTLVVRETARAQARAAWSEMAGLWRWTAAASGGLAVVCALGATALLLTRAEELDPVFTRTLAWGLALLPLVALGNLRGAAIRGLHRVIAGQLPELVIRPGAFLGLAGGLALIARAEITPSTAMAAHVAAAALAFVVGSVILARLAPVGQAAMKERTYHTRAWLASAAPLALIAGMQVVSANTDVVMLGLFVNSDDVGVYRVAVQGASLVAFGLHAVNMVISPQMASLHAVGDTEGLQRITTHGARMALVIALPAVLILILFGSPLMGLFFGEAFRRGGWVLAVLALGQLVNAMFGSVGMLLNMTGNERDTAVGVAVAAVANVLLNLLLIPPYGMMGAALATVATFAIWNGMLWRAALKRLGVSTVAVGGR